MRAPYQIKLLVQLGLIQHTMRAHMEAHNFFVMSLPPV